MSAAQDQLDLQRVQQALDTLGEHFDSVQIFVTRHESGEEGGTVNLNRGVGNWFSRYGQVNEWRLKQDERAREEVRQGMKEETE